MEKLIKYWQEKLKLNKWNIIAKRILPEQIVYNGETYFIGITRDNKNRKATIYHDIDLYEEAIIHELLHLKYPTQSELWINKETNKLLSYEKTSL
jgi:hypothetical protein